MLFNKYTQEAITMELQLKSEVLSHYQAIGLRLTTNQSQSSFLRGLQKLINILRPTHRDLPPASDEPTLFNKNLPHGICSGFSDVAAMAALDKNVHIGWATSYHKRFEAYWLMICAINNVEPDQLEAWLAARKGEVKHWLTFAEHILRYHNHFLFEALQDHSSYLSTKTGATQEFTMSVNLPIHSTEQAVRSDALAEFLGHHFLQNNLFSSGKTLRISDGRHRISITHHQENGAFVLHDANGSVRDIKDLSDLADRIINALDIHNLDARFIALNFYVLCYAQQDASFEAILKQLQTIEADHPGVDSLEDPQNKPMNQLLVEFHDHSRVGLIRDLLRFKSAVLDHALRRAMQEYLARYPDPRQVIERYQNTINMPTCSGHSWLHLQMMTGELDMMEELLQFGAKPNEGIDPTNKMVNGFDLHKDKIDDSEVKTPKRKFIKGGVKTKQWQHKEDDADTEIENSEEYLSYPIHYAVICNNLYALKALVNAGADVNRTTEMGETPLFLARKFHFDIIADFLIAQGAEEHVENNFPQSRNRDLLNGRGALRWDVLRKVVPVESNFPQLRNHDSLYGRGIFRCETLRQVAPVENSFLQPLNHEPLNGRGIFCLEAVRGVVPLELLHLEGQSGFDRNDDYINANGVKGHARDNFFQFFDEPFQIEFVRRLREHPQVNSVQVIPVVGGQPFLMIVARPDFQLSALLETDSDPPIKFDNDNNSPN